MHRVTLCFILGGVCPQWDLWTLSPISCGSAWPSCWLDMLWVGQWLYWVHWCLPVQNPGPLTTPALVAREWARLQLPTQTLDRASSLVNVCSHFTWNTVWSDWEIHQTRKYIRLGNTSDWEIHQTGRCIRLGNTVLIIGKEILSVLLVYLCTSVLQPNICIILWSFLHVHRSQS